MSNPQDSKEPTNETNNLPQRPVLKSPKQIYANTFRDVSSSTLKSVTKTNEGPQVQRPSVIEQTMKIYEGQEVYSNSELNVKIFKMLVKTSGSSSLETTVQVLSKAVEELEKFKATYDGQNVNVFAILETDMLDQKSTGTDNYKDPRIMELRGKLAALCIKMTRIRAQSLGGDNTLSLELLETNRQMVGEDIINFSKQYLVEFPDKEYERKWLETYINDSPVLLEDIKKRLGPPSEH